MASFFDFTTIYTDGFGMFSAVHFLWLVAGLFFCVFLCRLYRKKNTVARRCMRCATAGVCLFIELLRALLLAMAGAYDIGRLPLHLCAMAVYFEFFHAISRRSPDAIPGQFLYAFCMPGAFFALVFPDWTYYPALHFITVSGFVIHILLVTYVAMMVAGGDLKPDARKLPVCLLLMLCLAVPVFLFDRMTNTNYMFLNVPSAGSPLEWFAFLGRPGYLLGYVPLLAVTWACLYLPLRWKTRHGRPKATGQREA